LRISIGDSPNEDPEIVVSYVAVLPVEWHFFFVKKQFFSKYLIRLSWRYVEVLKFWRLLRKACYVDACHVYTQQNYMNICNTSQSEIVEKIASFCSNIFFHWIDNSFFHVFLKRGKLFVVYLLADFIHGLTHLLLSQTIKKND